MSASLRRGALLMAAGAAFAGCDDDPVEPLAPAGEVMYWSYAGGASDIFSVDANGSAPRRITSTGTAAEPKWSADGRWIVYLDGGPPIVRGQPSLQVFVMRADGTEARQITSDTGRVELPTISPDGQRVAYECGGRTFPGPFQICVVAVSGGPSVRVTPTSYESLYPAWAPDGAHIAFSCAPLEATFNRLCTIRPDGSELQAMSLDTLNVRSVAWAPDASRFVISAAPLDSIVNTLYFVSRDGRQVRRVFDETTPAAYRDTPTWSPDGLRIAFVRYGAQGAKVYVSNVDGSVERPLVDDARLQYDPSWSPTRP